MSDDTKNNKSDPAADRRSSDLTILIQTIANQEITERFNGIGIDDSTFEAKQRTIANNRLLNSLREDRDARQVALKRSFRSIATSVAGNAAWVVVTAVAVWAWQLYQNYLSGLHR